MAPAIGNRHWEARSTHGRNPIFESHESMWDAAVQYFSWVEDNPLYERKSFQFQGEIVTDDVPKMRAMTINGLCIYLDISEDTFANYSKKEDFLGVTSKIRSIIYDQKFSGAAADLLNANIIARDLGLKDASKSELSGPNGAPIQTQSAVIASEMKPDQAAEIYADLMQ